jgi:hypothetical protein
MIQKTILQSGFDHMKTIIIFFATVVVITLMVLEFVIRLLERYPN